MSGKIPRRQEFLAAQQKLKIVIFEIAKDVLTTSLLYFTLVVKKIKFNIVSVETKQVLIDYVRSKGKSRIRSWRAGLAKIKQSS